LLQDIKECVATTIKPKSHESEKKAALMKNVEEEEREESFIGYNCGGRKIKNKYFDIEIGSS